MTSFHIAKKYYFLYLYRNTDSGNADIAGIAMSPFSYDEEDLNERIHEKFSKVSKVAICAVSPDAIAKFIVDKHYWSPTAVLVLLSTLGFCGFNALEIERAFTEHEVYKRITFKPTFKLN